MQPETLYRWAVIHTTKIWFNSHAQNTENDEDRIEREDVGDTDGKTQDDAQHTRPNSHWLSATDSCNRRDVTIFQGDHAVEEMPAALQRTKPVQTMPSISVEIPGNHYLSPKGFMMRIVVTRKKD